MGFRVTIDLHHFYHDHRSSSRIFINDQLEKIKHVHDHISKRFEIEQNFYLISKDHVYIPPWENVKVLKEDDVVMIIPCNDVIIRNTTTTENENVAESNQKKKKEKKKTKMKLLEVEPDSEDIQKSLPEHQTYNCVIDNNISTKKKKMQENKQDDNEMEVDSNECTKLKEKRICFDAVYKDRKRNKVLPMQISTEPNIIKITRVEDSNFNLCKEFKKEINENDTTSKKDLNFDFLNKNVSEENVVSSEVKPHNAKFKILSNISINNDVTRKLTYISTDEVDSDQQKTQFIPPSSLSEFEKNKDAINGSLENISGSINFDVSSPQSSELESVTTETAYNGSIESLSERSKRKRKRCRKRKSNISTPVEFQTIPQTNFLPIQPTTKPVMHLKFDDAGNCTSEIGTIVNNNIEIQEHKDIASSEKEEMCLNPSKIVEETEEDKVTNFVNKIKNRKETLLLYSPLNYRKPQAGDLLAFKVMVLSPNITPEITDFIIAKVEAYCETTQIVNVEILDVDGEWLIPNEDLFSEEPNYNLRDKKLFSFNELLDVRLLLP